HAQPTAPGFAPRQQAMPVVFLRAAMIDEAVYGFVGDNTVPGLGLELAGEFEACVPMPSALAHRLCTGGLIAAAPHLGRLAVAPKLAADRTGRAAQNRRYSSH